MTDNEHVCCDATMAETLHPQVERVGASTVSIPTPMLRCAKCGKLRYSSSYDERIFMLQALAAALVEQRPVEPGAIRYAKMALDLTQAKLAQVLDVSPRTVSRYESGVHPIPLQVAFVLIGVVHYALEVGKVEDAMARLLRDLQTETADHGG